MKQRTDYVTNSSSSSFIFDNRLNYEKFKKDLRLEVERLHLLDDCYHIVNDINKIEKGLIPINKMLDQGIYDNFSLFELFDWWGKSVEIDIIEDYLGFDDYDREDKFNNKQLLVDFIYNEAFPDIHHYMYNAQDRGEDVDMISDKIVTMIEDIAKFNNPKEYIIHVFKRDSGASYIYYDGMETNSGVVDYLSKYTDSLIKHCCHMG